MSTKVAVSLEDYLAMSFEAETPELVDGELVARGEAVYPHAKAQSRAYGAFERAADSQPIYPGVEVRLRTGREKVRVADVAVFRGEEPIELIPSQPPFVVIEVVSRDDRHVDILTKLAEYHAWGVEHIWLIDPWTRRLSFFDGELHVVPALQLPDVGVHLTPERLFG